MISTIVTSTYLVVLLVLVIEYIMFKQTSLAVLFRSKERWFDIFGNLLFISRFNSIALKLISLGGSSWLFSKADIFSLNLFGFISEKVHVIFAYLVGLLIFDFLLYWSHRLKHVSDILWLTHRFHHSTENINIFSTLRVHSLDFPWRLATVSLPMVFIMGPNFETLAAFVFLETFIQIFSHTPKSIQFNRHFRFIVSPHFHHVHHSKSHMNSNYGLITTIWDSVFKTKANNVPLNLNLGIPDPLDRNVFKAYLFEFYFFAKQIPQSLKHTLGHLWPK